MAHTEVELNLPEGFDHHPLPDAPATIWASADDLTAPREVEVHAVDVPVVGTIGVRAISRAEYLHAGKLKDADGQPDGAAFERRVLAAGMVYPAMTEDKIAKWQKRPGSAAEIAPVMAEIMTRSGFRTDAAKSGV